MESIIILSVRSKDGTVPLVVIDGESDGKKTKYTITEGTYREIGCPLSGEVLEGDEAELLIRRDEERRALAKALSILTYADNGENQLKIKLMRHGFSKSAIDETVKECVRRGYIDDLRIIENAVLKLAADYQGKKKIIAKLTAKGFSAGTVMKTVVRLEAEGKIDFTEARRRLISEKLPPESTKEEKLKLLHRYGYI